VSRIEDALAKLRKEGLPPSQAERAYPGRPRGGARVDGATAPREHHYGGRRLNWSDSVLRAAGLVPHELNAAQVADEFRVLKRPLMRNAIGTADVPLANLLMVASADAGDGKTFTSLNLAVSIAKEKDWTAVLVDADAAKRHLTRSLGAQDEPGLIDLLTRDDCTFDELVMPTTVPGLAFLPVGARDSQFAELLGSEKMRALCERISSADPYRVIVFDSAPLLRGPDACVLAAQVGQIVIVVHANKTPRDALLRAQAMLDSTKPIGLLLNRAESDDGFAAYGSYSDQSIAS
jgi:Mrp family chromosome partitioning ATPase